jgi:hypothetical protein
MICAGCRNKEPETNSNLCNTCWKELHGRLPHQIEITHEQLEAEIRNASISRLPAILQCAVMTCVVKGVFNNEIGLFTNAITDAINAGLLLKEKR